MPKVHIGTSGWMYSGWKGIFYPDNLKTSDWLSFYSENFQTLEVNATFYHQMRPSTFTSWCKKVPKNFVFAVKANRFITHLKRLLNCGDPLKRLLEQVKGLGNNLGPVLFQLPPRWRANQKRLKDFLEELRNQDQELVIAFEFRDNSWLTPAIFKVSQKYNVATVVNDSPHFPKTEEITANFTYIRFHGPTALYSSEYSQAELEKWAAKIKSWKKQDIDIYAYFNNDVGGFAVKNARTLTSMMES